MIEGALTFSHCGTDTSSVIKNNDRPEISYSGSNYGTVKANVKVYSGCWYYEVKLESSGAVRIGWCTENYKPESNYVGIGQDDESWSFDPSRKYKYHNAKEDQGTQSYGDYVRQGEVVGCYLDLDNKKMSFFRNSTDLGVAYTNVKFSGALCPALSLSRSAKVTVNFGRDFSYKPSGKYAYFCGLNYILKPNEEKALNDVYQKYYAMGIKLSESGDTGCIKGQGSLELAKDLGAVGDFDPVLLILAWKTRATGVWEFTKQEFVNGLGLYGITDFPKLKKAVTDWKAEVKGNTEAFKSFYFYVFEYLKPEKSTALDKEEAQAAWQMIDMNTRWKLWPKWEQYLKESEQKSVTKDTWMMLIAFLEQNGSDLSKYDSMDCWPTAIDEFVDWYKEKK